MTKMTTPCEDMYDLSMVKELCRYDKKVIKSLAYQFVDTISNAVDSMKEDALCGQYGGLARTAHKIKPVLATFAVREATELVARIQSDVKNQVPREDLTALIDRLQRVTTLVVEDIKYLYMN